MIGGVNTNTLLGYAQTIALVLCLVGFLLAAVAMGEGAKDDAFVIRVWQALAGIDLPGGKH